MWKIIQIYDFLVSDFVYLTYKKVNKCVHIFNLYIYIKYQEAHTHTHTHTRARARARARAR